MAPAVVLLAAWRAGRIGPGVATWCAWAIVLSYVVQLAGLAVGLVAARGFADPWAHLLDFTAVVGVIVAGEYIGHAAAAALGVRALRRAAPIGASPCR